MQKSTRFGNTIEPFQRTSQCIGSGRPMEQAGNPSALNQKSALWRHCLWYEADSGQLFMADRMNSLKSFEIGIWVLLIMISLEFMASIWSTFTIYDLCAL